ncbi:PKD domain-containing protein [Niabella drilacis]|uniref:PKD repeat-containing protein n=1 Tax=Niabella drilacis (strain DSM 25811 / CCM 8410 / CCUG 62505 / LMG 26954 / E90) TaxID=1285928 RepID=A0A1G6S793_NIADE|nr:PKD domain-containing protein [Niabella drilacis]SDD12738.1 PKD repeat-containing protein [Niabella drilacis]
MKIMNYLSGIILVTALLLAGCKKDTANSAIIVDFSASKTALMAGDSVTFKEMAQGTVANWHWEFEGGTPAASNLSGPTVTYKTPGTYSVTLQLKNAAGEAVLTKEKMIVVGYSAIKAAFTQSKTVALQNETLQFTDKSTGLPTSWKWEFTSLATGAVISSDKQHPEISLTDTGFYNIRLIASNPEYRDTLQKEKALHIIDPHTLAASFGADVQAIYEGQQVQFTDQSLGIATEWAWEIKGAGTNLRSAEQNPSFQFDKAGIYAVTLSIKNTVASNSKTVERFINVIPANGLVGYFPFNGSIDDEGPLKLPVTRRGQVGAVQAGRNGLTTGIGHFDGSGGIIVGDDPAFNMGAGDFTISVWVQSTSTVRMMVWQESGKNGSKDNQAWLRLNSSATQYTAFNTEDAAGGSFLALADPGNIADGKWYHVVAVRSGLVTKLYINGQKMTERSSTTGIKEVSNSAAFKIGMQEGASSFSNYFIGNLDELIVYKRALTDAEITELGTY